MKGVYFYAKGIHLKKNLWLVVMLTKSIVVARPPLLEKAFFSCGRNLVFHTVGPSVHPKKSVKIVIFSYG
jgi:hypothetical protein